MAAAIRAHKMVCFALAMADDFMRPSLGDFLYLVRSNDRPQRLEMSPFCQPNRLIVKTISDLP